MITVKVPTLFYNDHRNRDCGKTGVIIKSGKLITEVQLDEVAFADLLSDADYYADMKKDAEEYSQNRSIVNSAINTLRQLKK